MPDSLKHSINAQRLVLNEFLTEALSSVTTDLPLIMHDADVLDQRLEEIFHTLGQCKYVYVLDAQGVQLSSNMTRYGADKESRGRNRSQRPYMQHMHDESAELHLSQAYISRNKKRPSVTAVKTIRNQQQQRVGFMGVDFDLRELPHSEVMYEEPSQWRQVKGDPAIRQGLFHQERVESLMDKDLDNVLSVLEALILDQGVHHVRIMFSASRSTIWHIDDPYIYRILTMDELSGSNVYLAYPRRKYFERATVPPTAIGKILKQFKALRFADEVIYLRSGSLNIVNGKVGLNFSCDGTHYLHYNEFLEKGIDFWLGDDSAQNAILPGQTVKASLLDTRKLDETVETLAGEGCIQVNKLLYAIEKGEIPDALHTFGQTERDYIYQELKSVMDVYEGAVCDLPAPQENEATQAKLP